MIIERNPNERLDDLGINQLKILQNPDLFCFGMDAVLLSAFVNVRKNEKVMDLCTGNGIVPILLSAKSQAKEIVGIEIQESSADLARRSVLINQLSDKITILQEDINHIKKIYSANSFEVVTCNPPYMIADHGLKNPDSAKAIARHELLCTFSQICQSASWLLKEGGSFFIVHRPFRLVELCATLTANQLEPKRMRFVHPFQDSEPNMVLIEARKGSKSRVRIEAPCVVYESENVYTKEIRELYQSEPSSV